MCLCMRRRPSPPVYIPVNGRCCRISDASRWTLLSTKRCSTLEALISLEKDSCRQRMIEGSPPTTKSDTHHGVQIRDDWGSRIRRKVLVVDSSIEKDLPNTKYTLQRNTHTSELSHRIISSHCDEYGSGCTLCTLLSNCCNLRSKLLADCAGIFLASQRFFGK